MRVWPLKSLPVRSCPRVTYCPYGPPPCTHKPLTNLLVPKSCNEKASNEVEEPDPGEEVGRRGGRRSQIHGGEEEEPDPWGETRAPGGEEEELDPWGEEEEPDP